MCPFDYNYLICCYKSLQLFKTIKLFSKDYQNLYKNFTLNIIYFYFLNNILLKNIQ